VHRACIDWAQVWEFTAGVHHPEELQAKLRENGIEDLSEVRKAYMEADGDVSVLKR
jgi:hypothetical protein